MKLNKKETAWLVRLRKTLAAAPISLDGKLSSYTVGDRDITLYDKVKFTEYYKDNPIPLHDIRYHCTLVEDSESELQDLVFTFSIESTAG